MVRAYGNENWEFDKNGLMRKRYARMVTSDYFHINDREVSGDFTVIMVE